MKKQFMRIALSTFATLSTVLSATLPLYAIGGGLDNKELESKSKEENTNRMLVINEVNSSPDDWVEIMNISHNDLDLSGYEIRDNSEDHRWKFTEGTIIKAHELLVVDAKTLGLTYDDQADSYIKGTFEAAIGIGSGDSIRLYDNKGVMIDLCSWTKHASYEGDAAQASVGRYPDGIGEFELTKETKGYANDWYKPEIIINEVESNGDKTDWVEMMNIGESPVDISGWYLLDNDPVGHFPETIPISEGTILNPGEYYVFEKNNHFTFGLGKEDKASIFNQSGVMITEYSWTSHAEGSYARVPDGIGELIDFNRSSKGEANIHMNPVVLNEIQVHDKKGGVDWIELANPTDKALDISGIIIKNHEGTSEYIVSNNTYIPANGFLVIDDLGFELDKEDAVYLFEKDRMLAEASWTEYTDSTKGLYPDINGKEYKDTKEQTPGSPNKFLGIPEITKWPGSNDTEIYDKTATFLDDSSGLDFFNGQLYAVDNGSGTFWIMNVAKNGDLSFVPGFEKGKKVRFQKDADNANAAGPDSEGITVDSTGLVYIAVERDNSDKGVNYNTILMINPHEKDTELVALKEWDLTPSLPQVSANMGIEAVEWVSTHDVHGQLYDQNTGATFDEANYPNAVADGVFFVALEDNGHVYAYVLNNDGSSIQIADIDSKLGGAMALDYDTYEKSLWVATDNGYDSRSAKITFNKEIEPAITHILPASSVDITANNEGFAIAGPEYTVNGQRPVYRFTDGVKTGALSIGRVSCKYSLNSDKDKNTMLPIRMIAQSLGAEIKWNHKTKEAQIILEDQAIIVGVNSEAVLYNNKMFVAADYISKKLGVKVR